MDGDATSPNTQPTSHFEANTPHAFVASGSTVFTAIDPLTIVSTGLPHRALRGTNQARISQGG